jgi:hypothetical protein
MNGGGFNTVLNNNLTSHYDEHRPTTGYESNLPRMHPVKMNKIFAPNSFDIGSEKDALFTTVSTLANQ